MFRSFYEFTEQGASRTKFRSFLIHFYHGMSLFLMGAAATMCLTEIGKRWIGRLRPHFIAVCKPDMSQLNCTSNALAGSYYNPIYTGGSFCTGDPDQIKEARFSVGQAIKIRHKTQNCLWCLSIWYGSLTVLKLIRTFALLNIKKIIFLLWSIYSQKCLELNSKKLSKLGLSQNPNPMKPNQCLI